MKSGDRPVSCVWITHVHLSARADAVGPCPAMPLHRCVQARAVRGLGTPCPCSRLALAHARPPSPPAAQTRLRPSADGGTSGRGAAGGSQYATFARAVNPNNRPPTLSAVAPSGSPRWRPQLGPWYGPADPLGWAPGPASPHQAGTSSGDRRHVEAGDRRCDVDVAAVAGDPWPRHRARPSPPRHPPCRPPQ